jgi:hypothetical protein
VAGSGKITWTGDLQAKLASSEDKAVRYLVKTTQYYSLMGESRMKKQARWTDRSSNARGGLTGEYSANVGKGGGEFAIDFYYTVPYGFWLEVRNFSKKGRLAVVGPTIDYIGPRYRNAALQVLAKVFS